MFKHAGLILGKDLRIEWRSRVALNQVLPFSLLVLILFAFALDPDRNTLQAASAGLFWIAVVFTLLLAVQRSFAIETADGGGDALRMAGLEPAGIFLGKGGALCVQLLALEALLVAGIVVLYDAPLRLGGALLLLLTCILATVGLAAAGTLYGALAAGLRVRDTLLPLLVLPVVAPVLIGATRSFEAALGLGGASTSDGWPWVGLLGVFALAYTAFGLLGFGTLLEEA